MYLNKGKCLLEIIVNGILTLIFGWNALVMAFGLLLIETGQVGKNRDIDSIGVVILVTFAVLFIFFFQRLRIPFMAIKMSRLLETDKDGLVSVIDLAEQLKKRQSKLIAVFIKCVGKGFLVNCGIFAVDPTYIILGTGFSKYAIASRQKTNSADSESTATTGSTESTATGTETGGSETGKGTPKTGDDMPLSLLMLLLAVSGTGCLYLVKEKCRKAE